VRIFFFLLSAYLLGSLPSAYLAAKFLKKGDIRTKGSGNVGATNVLRVAGKLPALLVLIIDIAKGLAAVVILPRLFFAANNPFSASRLSDLLPAFFCVIGHIWPVWLKFKGGKGVATSLGVLIALSFRYSDLGNILFVAAGVFLLVVLLTRYVSLASLIACLVLPIWSFFAHQPPEMAVFLLLLCLIIIYKHKSNIFRLLRGEEHKLSFKTRS
jgi:glycerol-3-phosphate acyltransferase PlsY